MAAFLVAVWLTLALAFFLLFRKGIILMTRKDKDMQIRFMVAPQLMMALVNIVCAVIAITWPVSLPLLALKNAIERVEGMKS